MEKSLEFVLDRIKSGRTRGMNIKDYKKAYEYKFTDFLKSCSAEIQSVFKDNKFVIDVSDTNPGSKQRSTKIIVEYNPNSDFDYFTMKSCCCDGTLVFYDSLMKNIINDIFTCGTHNIDKVPDDLETIFFDYLINYTIGDFVLNDEYGEQFATKEKPWMLSRFTAMLPLKCEFNKKI